MSMMINSKRYDREFVYRAVRMVLGGDGQPRRGLVPVAEELGLPTSTLYRWIYRIAREALAGPISDRPGPDVASVLDDAGHGPDDAPWFGDNTRPDRQPAWSGGVGHGPDAASASRQPGPGSNRPSAPSGEHRDPTHGPDDPSLAYRRLVTENATLKAALVLLVRDLDMDR